MIWHFLRRGKIIVLIVLTVAAVIGVATIGTTQQTSNNALDHKTGNPKQAATTGAESSVTTAEPQDSISVVSSDPSTIQSGAVTPGESTPAAFSPVSGSAPLTTTISGGAPSSTDPLSPNQGDPSATTQSPISQPPSYPILAPPNPKQYTCAPTAPPGYMSPDYCVRTAD